MFPLRRSYRPISRNLNFTRPIIAAARLLWEAFSTILGLIYKLPLVHFPTFFSQFTTDKLPKKTTTLHEIRPQMKMGYSLCAKFGKTKYPRLGILGKAFNLKRSNWVVLELLQLTSLYLCIDFVFVFAAISASSAKLNKFFQ